MTCSEPATFSLLDRYKYNQTTHSLTRLIPFSALLHSSPSPTSPTFPTPRPNAAPQAPRPAH